MAKHIDYSVAITKRKYNIWAALITSPTFSFIHTSLNYERSIIMKRRIVDIFIFMFLFMISLSSNVYAKETYVTDLSINQRESAAQSMFRSTIGDNTIVDISVGAQDRYGRFAAVVCFEEPSAIQGAKPNIECYNLAIEGVDNDNIVYWATGAIQFIGGMHPEQALYDSQYLDGANVFGFYWNAPTDSTRYKFSSKHPEGTSIFSVYIHTYADVVHWVIKPFEDLSHGMLSVIFAFFYSVLRGMSLMVIPFILLLISCKMMTSTNRTIRRIGKVSALTIFIVCFVLSGGIFILVAALHELFGGATSYRRANRVYRSYDRRGSFREGQALETHEIRDGKLYTYEGSSVKQPWEAKTVTKIEK